MKQEIVIRDKDAQRMVMATIFFGGIMAALNTSTLNIAIPSFMETFNADVVTVQWMVVGYMLAMGVVTPLVGYFADRYSIRRLYCFGLILMGVCSVLCSLAWDIYLLIFLRMVSGIAGGIIMPCSMTMIYQFIPRKQQAQFLSINMMAASFGPAIGPTLSGYLLGTLGWHSIFLCNVPFAVVAYILAKKALPYRVSETQGHLDRVGIGIISIGTLLVLLAFSNVEAWGWISSKFLGLVAIGGCMIGMFIKREVDSSDPLLNFRVFKYKQYTLSTVINGVTNMALCLTPFLMSLYLQNVLGLSPVKAGSILLFPALLMALMAPITGKLYYVVKNKVLIIPGVLMVVLGTFQCSKLGVSTPIWVIIFWLSIRYIGIGISNLPIADYGMSAVPRELTGHASSMTTWFRQLVMTLSMSAFTSLFSIRVLEHSRDMSNLGGIEVEEINRSAQMLAINDLFLYTALIVGIAFVLGLGIKSNGKRYSMKRTVVETEVIKQDGATVKVEG